MKLVLLLLTLLVCVTANADAFRWGPQLDNVRVTPPFHVEVYDINFQALVTAAGSTATFYCTRSFASFNFTNANPAHNGEYQGSNRCPNSGSVIMSQMCACWASNGGPPRSATYTLSVCGFGGHNEGVIRCPIKSSQFPDAATDSGQLEMTCCPGTAKPGPSPPTPPPSPPPTLSPRT